MMCKVMYACNEGRAMRMGKSKGFEEMEFHVEAHDGRLFVVLLR